MHINLLRNICPIVKTKQNRKKIKGIKYTLYEYDNNFINENKKLHSLR